MIRVVCGHIGAQLLLGGSPGRRGVLWSASVEEEEYYGLLQWRKRSIMVFFSVTPLKELEELLVSSRLHR